MHHAMCDSHADAEMEDETSLILKPIPPPRPPLIRSDTLQSYVRYFLECSFIVIDSKWT